MRPLTILAIDDDPLIGLVVSAFVQRLGHVVVHVLSGEEGIAEYQREPFDLVLVDRQMPGLDGLQQPRRCVNCSKAAVGGRSSCSRPARPPMNRCWR